MDLIDLNSLEGGTIITDRSSITKYSEIAKNYKVLVKCIDEISDMKESSQPSVLLHLPDSQLTSDLLNKILKLLKPGAKLTVKGAKDFNNLELNLKTAGFITVHIETDENIVGVKPLYAIGSATKVNLKKKKDVAVWKIEDDAEDEETIDPDNLLDDDDLIKPDPSSLRVCGTTGKRKACKDCSCGLAEELQADKVVDTANAPKSSCGSCYLGDAFRCASCPYLGMPAFKPGEKIQLSDNLLKADL